MTRRTLLTLYLKIAIFPIKYAHVAEHKQSTGSYVWPFFKTENSQICSYLILEVQCVTNLHRVALPHFR